MPAHTHYYTVETHDADLGLKLRAYRDLHAKGQIHMDEHEFIRIATVHYKCVPTQVEGKETYTVAEAIVAWKD